MLQATVSSPAFAAFVFASLVLAITPGPGVIYLVTRTLSRGRKAGLASIGGIALGDLGNAVAASIGLAAVLSASAAAFVAVKLAGAGYLVFLGIKALRAPQTAHVPAPIKLLRPFRDGFWVALLNPKTALFFAALTPQFIDPHRPYLGQSLILGGVFVSIAMCTDTLYVLAASALTPAISSRRSYGKYVSAATFIGLGVYAALASPRSSR
jgi:threonine/homoserine/homoserine lactone efflux protein